MQSAIPINGTTHQVTNPKGEWIYSGVASGSQTFTLTGSVLGNSYQAPVRGRYALEFGATVASSSPFSVEAGI